MSRKIPARLAIIGLVVADVMLSTLSPGGLIYAGLTVPYAAMGALLVIRRPRTSIGWILIGLGSCFALISVPVTGTPQQFVNGSVDLPVALFAIIHSGLGTTAFFLYAVLMMVFPFGRLPVGRWGRLGRVGLGVTLVFAAAAYVMPEIRVGYPVGAWVRNPAALLPDLSIWRVITPGTVILPVIVLAIAGAVSMIVRVTRATGTERQQLRWIAASFAVLMSAVVSGFVIGTLVPGSGDSGLAWIPAMVAWPSVPIAVGIAVLRYRLYEIDRIVSRTISWAIVTGLLVSIYLAGVLVLQSSLSQITQGETLAVAASTLLAAAVFQPARRRIQRLVDRRFDRARYDGEHTIATYTEDLRDQVDLQAISVHTVAAVDAAVRPRGTSLWLREPGR